MPMPPRRQPFLPSHALEYAWRWPRAIHGAVQRHAACFASMSAATTWRSVGENGRKRQRTQKVRLYIQPFFTHNCYWWFTPILPHHQPITLSPSHPLILPSTGPPITQTCMQYAVYARTHARTHLITYALRHRNYSASKYVYNPRPSLMKVIYKIQGGAIFASAAATNATINVGVPTFDASGKIFHGNEEMTNSRYFTFAEPCVYKDPSGIYGNWKGQINRNGFYYPSFNATLPIWYGITRNSLPSNSKQTKISLRQYQKKIPHLMRKILYALKWEYATYLCALFFFK